MKTYKNVNKRSLVFFLFIYVTIILVIYYFGRNVFDRMPILTILLLVPVVQFLLGYFRNSYTIDSKNRILSYKYSYRKTDIHIEKITKIEKTIPGGSFRKFFTKDGMVLCYSNDNQLLITPEKRDEFIKDLKKINSKIQVVE